MRRTAPGILVMMWVATITSSSPSIYARTDTRVPFEIVAEGTVSRIRESVHFVVRDQAAWQGLWRQHSGSVAAPPVDFVRDMVIAIFAGEFSEPAALAITRIIREPTRLIVLYRVAPTRPPVDGVSMRPVIPFHIVRVARTALPVVFSQIKTPPVAPQP